MVARSGTLLGTGLLITAGLYQLGLPKEVCVQACRSPLQFIATRWKEGRSGALLLGLQHGVYCFGCCWAGMLLLFVGGVMNLLWLAVISVYSTQRCHAAPRFSSAMVTSAFRNVSGS
jgi:predicted metal-binding membrane protein